MPVNMKAMIAETFLTLAGQKNVDKITVKDLVEACGISRQTFYYHFQDIIDVVEWLVERDTQAMLERSLAAGDPREAIRIFVADVVESGICSSAFWPPSAWSRCAGPCSRPSAPICGNSSEAGSRRSRSAFPTWRPSLISVPSALPDCCWNTARGPGRTWNCWRTRSTACCPGR